MALEEINQKGFRNVLVVEFVIVNMLRNFFGSIEYMFLQVS